jgi:hypothetical protein
MSMKRMICASALYLLLGTIAPANAQDEHQKQDQSKPEQRQPPAKPAQEPHPQPANIPARTSQQPQQHQQATPVQQLQQTNRPAPRPQQAYGGVYHGGVKPTEPTHGGVHPSGVPQQQGQVRSGFLQSRAPTSWNTDHRSWTQRGGYTGYRVPDDRFKLYFGSDHFFRIDGLPLLFVGGYPRFQYDGYWVTFVDPWPETWPPTWYETDDVYIDYTSDGYYVYDRNYPGIGIAVTISF